MDLCQRSVVHPVRCWSVWVHRIGILALDDVVPFDLSVPCGVLGHASLADGSTCYSVTVCGVGEQVRSRPFDIHLAHGLGITVGAEGVELHAPGDRIRGGEHRARRRAGR